MKLVLNTDQEATLHSSARSALTLAASMPTIDRAVEVLKAHLTGQQWEIGRGGHHAFVLWKQYGQKLRVATIDEAQEKATVWQVKCIGWMQGTHTFKTKKAAQAFVIAWRGAEGNDQADHSATLLRNGVEVK